MTLVYTFKNGHTAGHPESARRRASTFTMLTDGVMTTSQHFLVRSMYKNQLRVKAILPLLAGAVWKWL